MNAGNREKVVDANVLIHSRGQINGKILLTPGVKEELKSQNAELNLEKLDYSVYQPSNQSIEKVEEKSGEINSPTSSEDEEALALALDKDAELVTDDKALQNLAEHLQAEYSGFNEEEIEEKREWTKVCGNCGREVKGESCEACGSERLERKRR